MTYSRRYTQLLAACAALGLTGQYVEAQSSDASDWDNSGRGAAPTQCVPQCRSGYECKQGECIAFCNPACEPGFLCGAGGHCIRTQQPVQSAPVQTWAPPTNQCVPACRSSYVCVSGQCVSACNPICAVGDVCTETGECVPASSVPAPGAPPVLESRADAPPPEEPSKHSVVNIHADAAGLLQFGLTPTLEIGKRFSGYLRLRLPNTGLASYFLLARKDGEDFKWGLGGALGMHWFSAKQGTMRGIFGGPAVEYAFVKSNQSKQDINYGTHVVIPELDLGYRWGFDSFLLGLGGRLGLAIPVGAFETGVGSSHCRGGDCDRPINFLAGVVADVGFFL